MIGEKKVRVRMEPELEEIAGDWPALKRLENGRKFLRWGRQLLISGKIMLKDANPHPRASLRLVARRKAAWN